MLEIHNWQAFESNAAGRRPKDGMRWYCMTTNLNGRGRLALTRHGIEGLAAIAVFEGLVKYAASFPIEKRGTLTRGDGTAVSVDDLSQILSVSSDILRVCIGLLLDVGWLVDQTGSYLINIDQTRSNLIKNVPRGEEKRGEERREEKNVKKHLTDYPDSFVEFWQVYPRKVNKKAALKAWKKAAVEIEPHKITIAAEMFAASDIAAAGEFIPHPATWLNKGGYLDDPKEWERREPKSKEQKRQEANFEVLANVSKIIDQRIASKNGQNHIHATNGDNTKRISDATKRPSQHGDLAGVRKLEQ